MKQLKKTILTLVALLAVTTQAWAETGENIFQYCYDCQRSPAYPKTTASASLSGFANPLVGYKGSGFDSDNTSAGPWKLEYMGLWSTTDQHEVDDVSYYQYTYNCTDVPVFRLYQWNATANEYQHAAYGVVCAYAKVSNAVEHSAMFVSEDGWGCVLTNSSHSSSMNITFDEDLTTGLTTLIAAATPEPTEWSLTPDETGKKWTLAEMPASNIELQVEYFAESNLFLSKDALADKASIAVTAGDLGVQFGDDGKSANTVTEGSAMTVTYNGTKKILGMKVEKKEGNTYLKWDADQKKLVATEIPTTAIKVENSNEDVEWAGTYVVEKEVTINGKIILTNNVNLIIKDGAKLIVNRFINGKSKNLSIYSQAQKTGELVVNCSGDDAFFNLYTLEVHSAKVKATSPNDGGGGVYNTTTLNVYGGSLDAECTGSYGHGILLQAGGFMNIYGGEVKAVGKGNDADQSYGITSSSVVNVTVYGGKLWAECATNKALNNITLTKDAGYTSGTIKHSSDKLVWFDGVDADAKYVKVE